MEDLGMLAALVIVGPYVVGWPIAIVWMAVALSVEYLTGWRGLAPADVWHAADRSRPL